MKRVELTSYIVLMIKEYEKENNTEVSCSIGFKDEFPHEEVFLVYDGEKFTT